MSKTHSSEVELSLPTAFISYASEDRPRATQLYKRLRAAGYKPWMDSEDIVGGEDWSRSIERAISQAEFFLVCLSAHSVEKRGYLQREILGALDKWREKLPDDIYLLPVRLEECQRPERLSRFQTIDLFQDDGWNRLFEALQVGVSRRGRLLTPSQVGRLAYRIVPKQIVEKGPEGKFYRLELSFPQIVPENESWVAELNLRSAGWVVEEAQTFRACRLWWKGGPEGPLPSALSITYVVRLFSPELLSLEFRRWSYGSGAAHGNTTFETFNLLLNPPTSLSLDAL